MLTVADMTRLPGRTVLGKTAASAGAENGARSSVPCNDSDQAQGKAPFGLAVRARHGRHPQAAPERMPAMRWDRNVHCRSAIWQVGFSGTCGEFIERREA